MVGTYTRTQYKRKYAEHDNVSFVDLRSAYEIAASMVAKHGDKYLPIFERLDKEIQTRKQQEHIKAKALEVAKKAKIKL